MAEITQEQRANLIKLARYLFELPEDYEHFDMGVFNSGAELPCLAGQSCGSAACAVGHGPYAGIYALPGEGWRSYSYRSFCADDLLWSFMFSDLWELPDDTPVGAAQRITMVLIDFDPDEWGFDYDSEEVDRYSHLTAADIPAS